MIYSAASQILRMVPCQSSLFVTPPILFFHLILICSSCSCFFVVGEGGNESWNEKENEK